MKQIVCEVCGSNDLVKEDGCFICQYCGAKYSPEEAKRLIVEVNGKVDVSGSKVTVDNTSFVERSLENARRAKAKEDWEECEKYYNMVEQYEPTNYNVPLVKTQMKKIIVTAKTLYSHPKNVSKIYAALHTDLAW